LISFCTDEESSNNGSAASTISESDEVSNSNSIPEETAHYGAFKQRATFERGAADAM
jgi:hypothetical protein